MSTPEYDDLERDFGEVISLLRSGVPETPIEQPSEAVWDAIANELDLTGRARDRVVSELPIQPVPADDTAEEAAPDVNESAGQGAVVRDITSARSWGRTTAILTAMAAALLLVAIPVGLALNGGSDADSTAELAALSGYGGTGEAELDGRDLQVRVEGEAAPEGSFYELWLLDTEGDDVVDLLSLGLIEVDDDGSFVVPDGLDLERFDVVDVSIEPDDGDPNHSGVSILRGGLVST